MISLKKSRILNWTPVDKSKVKGVYNGVPWTEEDGFIHIDNLHYTWDRERAMNYLGFISRSPEWDAQIIIDTYYYMTETGVRRRNRE